MAIFREACAIAFLKHPELRSVALSLDWAGALNDAQINHGMWLGVTGPERTLGAVGSLEAIFGSAHQTLRLLEKHLSRAYEVLGHLRENAQVLATEVVQKHEELEKLKKESPAR